MLDVTDLVENPREDLEIECKAWLDLSDNVQRAKVARHLAALANHGGGYLLFGFNDDLTRDRCRPSDIGIFSRDAFSDIIRKYLTPRFQCELTYVTADNGDQFPVVRVPGHGTVPIASKADGPMKKPGGPQGIRSGVYYVRKPGPESAPVLGAEDWDPIIRRCVLNDRDRLLSDFSVLMQRSERRRVEGPDRLAEWHRGSEERFLKLLPGDIGARWPVSIKEHRYQLSYLISTDGGELLEMGRVSEILQRINLEVRNTVWTGWSMFFPFSGPDVAPRAYAENRDGSGGDVLECDLMRISDLDYSLPDYWRLAPDGRVTLLRAYREDRRRSNAVPGRRSGTWLSPETVIRETTELVTHARLLARYFPTASRIAFRCTWMGLQGRRFADFDRAIYWRPTHVASADCRTTEGEWPVATVAANWSGIVAQLCAPVLHLFNFTGCNAVFVEGLAPKFVKL